MSTSNDPTDRGPWPEPDEADAKAESDRLARQAVAAAADLDAAGGRVVDQLDDIDDQVAAWDGRTDAAGSKGVSIAVAAVSVGYLLMLPVLLAIAVYTFITVYAVVKAIESGPDTADGGVVLIGIVGLVTFLVLLLGGGLWAIGRAADPKKRQRY